MFTNIMKKDQAHMLLWTFELGAIFLWLSNLVDTNSYFSVYCLCAMGALFCFYDSGKKGDSLHGKNLGTAVTLSILFGFLVTAANYPIFQQIRNPAEVSAGSNRLMNLLECAATFLGGIPVCYHLLQWLCCRVEGNDLPVLSKPVEGKKPFVFFLWVFGILAMIDMIYLFLVDYPGSISHDSLRQIEQTVTGEYNNVLPYWYTRLIGFVLSMGYGIFEDPNRACAFYSFLQLLAMTAIFAYTLLTLYERKVSRLFLSLAFVFYAFVPYNIAFSTSMWKDVLFTGFVLLMVTAQYRCLKKLGNSKANLAMMILGGIGVGIMRTNGWYVVALSFLILLLCGKEIRRTLALGMAAASLAGFLLNVPVLKIMDVPGLDKVETMSLPIQQMARVIVKERELNSDDLALLNEIVDVDRIPEEYQDWTSDPMKNMVSQKNPQFIENNLGEFLGLWIKLGLQHPMDYLEAWVELTKGYWNGGYDYYIYAEYVADNDYGIFMDQSMNPIKALVKAYFAFSRESVVFEPILSIGLQVWITIACWWVCGIQKKKETVLFIPLLVILAGLWVGAPVFSEFRYAYPVAAAVPLVLTAALERKGQ